MGNTQLNISAHPNAGLPNAFGHYDQTPEEMQALIRECLQDNLINIKVAEKILNRWNIVVDVALNGLIGLEKFHANTYDLILMDLSMPVMDGYEASAKIRLVNSTIPIIALTASTSYLSLEKAIQIGANEYITKPFVPKELNMKLCKYFKKSE